MKILAAVFVDMEPSKSWLRDPAEVIQKMRGLAAQAIPVAVALRVAAVAREDVGNVDIKPKGINQTMTLEQLVAALDQRIKQEEHRIEGSLDAGALEALARSEFERLMNAITDGTNSWKRDIAGRVLLIASGIAQLKPGRLETFICSGLRAHQTIHSKRSEIFSCPSERKLNAAALNRRHPKHGKTTRTFHPTSMAYSLRACGMPRSSCRPRSASGREARRATASDTTTGASALSPATALRS